jgi:hypothetical protein
MGTSCKLILPYATGSPLKLFTLSRPIKLFTGGIGGIGGTTGVILS